MEARGQEPPSNTGFGNLRTSQDDSEEGLTAKDGLPQSTWHSRSGPKATLMRSSDPTRGEVYRENDARTCIDDTGTRPSKDSLRREQVSTFQESPAAAESTLMTTLPPTEAERGAKETKVSACAPPLWKRLLLDTWMTEVMAIVPSVACLVAIAGVLAYYDNRPSPQMFYGITLNAIVAILGAASRSALLFFVASGLSQLKWIWFLKRRKLVDLQSFDDASRGPAGSLAFLLHAIKRPIASIGAVVTVLALAFDPFVQQVLDYPVRGISRPSQGALTLQANVLDMSPFEPAYTWAINAGIWSSSLKDVKLETECSTGNCSWPEFPSVGWCATCGDTTSSAVIKSCDISAYFRDPNYNLSCDLSVGYGNSVSLAAKKESQFPPSYTAFNISTVALWPIWDVWQNDLLHDSVLGVENPPLVLGYGTVDYDTVPLNGDPDQQWFTAHVKAVKHCVFSPCTRRYQVATNNGVTTTNIVGIDYGSYSYYPISLPDGFQHYEPSSSEPVDICWQADPGKVIFGEPIPSTTSQFIYVNLTHHAFCPVDAFTTLVGQRLIGQAWHAYGVPKSNENGTTGASVSGSTFESDTLEMITSSNTFVGTIKNVAASITKLGEDRSGKVVHGNMTTLHVHVHVNWMWLIFPILLEAAGIAMFLATVILTYSKSVRLWKTSVFPFLYHGLQAEHFLGTEASEAISGMELRAQGTSVRLCRSAQDGRFMLNS